MKKTRRLRNVFTLNPLKSVSSIGSPSREWGLKQRTERKRTTHELKLNLLPTSSVSSTICNTNRDL